jgi:hypothetical protein
MVVKVVKLDLELEKKTYADEVGYSHVKAGYLAVGRSRCYRNAAAVGPIHTS